MIGTAVFAKLTSLDLGLDDDGFFRIYPNCVRMDEKSFPQIVFDLEGYEPEYSMDGSDGVPSVTCKLLCVAQDYDTADVLGRQVANALDGTRGMWGDTDVRGCFLDEVSEEHVVDTDNESVLYFVKEMSFKIIYQA